MTLPAARVLAGGLFAVALACGWALGGGAPSYADDGHVHPVFTIGSPEISESSSLAVSTVHEGLVYTANDSGDSATVYVLDDDNGRLVGRARLAGVDAVDIEALGVGQDGTLVVGDIGDNTGSHSHVTVYRIPQPGRGDHTVTPTAVRLTYVDGARDAEALLYDARSGRVFVVSKQIAGSHIYQTPPHAFHRRSARLGRVGRAPVVATGASWLPGRRYAVIRTYIGATIYHYRSWRQATRLSLPSQEQGESIAVPPHGSVAWVGSEGVHSTVLAVPLPKLSHHSPKQHRADGPSPQPSLTPSNQQQRSDYEHQRDIATTVLVAAAAALAVLLAAAAVMVVRRRR
ncbi:MAG: hypothetical protein ACRDQA_02245 [Nocardioidaceae bacterium]